MSGVGEDLYEIQMAYKRITVDTPLYIGVNVLFEAKIQLLKFHRFLAYFIRREHFSHILCDTDSLYTAYHFPSLDESVREDRREEFERRLSDHCGQRGKERHPEGMLPRRCCAACRLDDEKEPYLFKLEFKSKLIIALCSKTYICESEDEKIKLSCKGVNKRAFLANDPVGKFKQVLETKQAGTGFNAGFRAIEGKIYTYKSEKKAFPWFYMKREILPGGHFTRTIDITLIAVPKHHICIQTDMEELGPDHVLSFQYNGYEVRSIRQAQCLMKYVYCTRYKLDSLVEPLLIFSRILKTLDARQLHELEVQLPQCDAYLKDRYDVLEYIVVARMRAYPRLYKCLPPQVTRYIVNACQYDTVSGNGYNYRVTRWRKDAFLCGENYLGKIYMGIITKRKVDQTDTQTDRQTDKQTDIQADS